MRALLVSPLLILEEVTIVLREFDEGHAGFEDWSELVDPEDDDNDAVGEEEREHWEAKAVMTSLGGFAESWLGTGDLVTPVPVGWGEDRRDIIAAGTAMELDGSEGVESVRVAQSEG